MFEVTSDLSIPLSDLHWSFVRSSGPGGQNVNKVASKAVLRWDANAGNILDAETLGRLQKLFPGRLTKNGEIVITSQTSRDALKNKAECLRKLKNMLIKALKKPKRRIPTKPTRGSIERRLENKRQIARKKENRKIQE